MIVTDIETYLGFVYNRLGEEVNNVLKGVVIRIEIDSYEEVQPFDDVLIELLEIWKFPCHRRVLRRHNICHASIQGKGSRPIDEGVKTILV